MDWNRVWLPSLRHSLHCLCHSLILPTLQASEGVTMGLLLRVLTETWALSHMHCPHPTKPHHLAQMDHDACKVEIMHI